MRPTRFDVMNELRSIIGHTEETEILIDWLQDTWQTYDALIERVGKERAYQIKSSTRWTCFLILSHTMI